MKHILFLFLLGLAWSCSLQRSDVHEWRGPDRSGIYQGVLYVRHGHVLMAFDISFS